MDEIRNQKALTLLERTEREKEFNEVVARLKLLGADMRSIATSLESYPHAAEAERISRTMSQAIEELKKFNSIKSALKEASDRCKEFGV
ncbi:MAG: hypothetical protein WAM39_23805 [Bryobacteraceae bacterium]